MIRSHEESQNLWYSWALLGLVALSFLAVGCSKSPSEKGIDTPEAFDPSTVELHDPDLIAGREIWMSTCKTCHLTGLTGAPIIGNQSAWQPRVAKGLDTLYDHAINGFIGPDYTEMPPKGGFAELSDEEVRQAVRFMASTVQ